MKENEDKIVLLKKESEERQKALPLLRDSEPWKQYTEYMDELILLENNAGKKESEIKGIISPLNKALGRLKQLSDSGRHVLKPESKESLNLCLTDTTKVNPGFFVEFNDIVKSGVLNLTSEKTDKIMEQTKLAASSFGSFKNEYLAIIREIERKKNEISAMDIAHEEAELTKTIADLQEKLTALEKELESSREHLTYLKHDIELKRQELQHCITVIDSRIRIL